MVLSRPLTEMSEPWRQPCESLEEVCAQSPRDLAGALAFALSRRPAKAARAQVLLIAPRFLWKELGYGFAAGLKGRLGEAPVLLVETRREIEALWALEEALKSKAVDLAVAWLQAPSLLASRRIDFAARAGGAAVVFLMGRAGGGLSAARRRWTVSAAASAPHADDPRAPGRPRLVTQLTRSRGEPPAQWILEWDDEAHRFGLAAELADHGLVEGGRAIAAA